MWQFFHKLGSPKWFFGIATRLMPWLLAVFMLMHFLMIRKQGISGPL